jgi:hypothetical protein
LIVGFFFSFRKPIQEAGFKTLDWEATMRIGKALLIVAAIRVSSTEEAEHKPQPLVADGGRLVLVADAAGRKTAGSAP